MSHGCIHHHNAVSACNTSRLLATPYYTPYHHIWPTIHVKHSSHTHWYEQHKSQLAMSATPAANSQERLDASFAAWRALYYFLKHDEEARHAVLKVAGPTLKSLWAKSLQERQRLKIKSWRGLQSFYKISWRGNARIPRLKNS